jgi:hypothetical protein
MGLFETYASGHEGSDKRVVSVPPPSAYQGVCSALRNSYPAPALSDEFMRLLARIK